MDRPCRGGDLLSRIRIVERTGSTNADLLADAGAVEGDWLVALEQEAGKGRQGREWVGASGNFFGSTLVELKPGDPPAPSLSLAAGLALIDSVEAAAPHPGFSLKWPNDLLLGTAKLAGILLERQGDRVVAGFGVNLASAPALPGRECAALAPIARVTPQSFAPLIAAAFARALEAWRHDLDSVRSAWLSRAHPLGTPLGVHTGSGERMDGSFAGLEPDGALRLRRDDGSIEIVRAGDVEL